MLTAESVSDSRFYDVVARLYNLPNLFGLATHRLRSDFLYRSNDSGVPLLYHWRGFAQNSGCLTPQTTPVSGYAALHAEKPWVLLAVDEGGSENYKIVQIHLDTERTEPLTPRPIGRVAQLIWVDDNTWLAVGGDMVENYVRLFRRDGEKATLYRSERWMGRAAYDGGNRVYISVGRGPHSTNFDIGILDLSKREMVHWLSEGEDSEDSRPTFLHGYLAYATDVERERPTVVVRSAATLAEVGRYPAPGDIETLAWQAPGQLLATISSNAVSRPHTLATESGVWEAAPAGGSTWGAALTASGPVWSGSSLAQPSTIFRWDDSGVVPLVHGAVEQGFTAGESVWYRSFDDREVQGWLLRHANARSPLVVYVHGGPASVSADMWRTEIQALAQAGYHVFAPNYRGSSTFGSEFRLLNVGDLGGGDLQDVLYGARHVTRMLDLERKPAITGRSYGGYLTLFALTTQPEEWAGGVAVVPVTDWVQDYLLLDAGFRFYDVYYFRGTPEERPALYRERSPITYIDRLRAPTLILHGENDSRCPIEPVRHFAAEAQRLAKPVTMVMTRDEGHGNQQRVSAIRDTVLTLEHLASLW